MPKPFPKEFRRDVIAVARQGDQSIAAVARSFGISESCLSRWLKIADREDGITVDELWELVEPLLPKPRKARRGTDRAPAIAASATRSTSGR
ncbi:transposase [Pseudonocardia kujensis]|uniref:transposase n=1 Tax=Pseudonocardia kujensis TaxID=1128675 RepID=UPI0027DFE657|nr:transposase [Pseudonocardia kujensis]